MLFTDFNYHTYLQRYESFSESGYFRMTDLGCWRFTLMHSALGEPMFSEFEDSFLQKKRNLFISLSSIAASTDPKLGTDIMLSSNTIVENSPNGTKIGSLSISNGEPGETYSFSLVYYTDVPFKIVGKDVVLVAKRPLDYETNQSIGIAVAAYNSKGRTVQQLFMIRIISKSNKTSIT